MGTACLFLAGKVEETHKKLNEVVMESYTLRNQKQPSKESFGRLRERVLEAELSLLQEINFDLNIEHPYQYLVQFFEILNIKEGFFVSMILI